MPLSSGSHVGPYEIVSQIGAGGMGEVYRARDSRLRREVALKVLPSSFAADRDRLNRFEREAHATAALNHPNIVSIYDIGTENGTPYIVSELLQGETLRQRLRSGALPVRKAIEYSIEITHGLSAAHAKGIVHRDLKPENLFITKDGWVKILDFGLVRLAECPDSTGATRSMPTEATEPGMVLGTVGYMSPEQVRGQVVDRRSDLFSFGGILYEMLSGKRAFEGNTAADVMSAILKEDPPDLTGSSPGIPPGLERLVRHCLEKNPEDRFQSAHDLALALGTLSGASTRVSALSEAPTGNSRPRPWRIAVAGLALVAVLGAGLLLGRRVGVKAVPPSFHPLTFRRGTIFSARFAPDGENVIYSARWETDHTQLFLTRPENPESRPLGLTDSSLLAISSSGEMAISLGCQVNGPPLRCRGTLARVAMGGSAPREILEGVLYADWSPDGKDFAVVRRESGRVRLEFPIGKVLAETDGLISSPRISPKGDAIAFIDHPINGDNRGSVAMVDLRGNRRTLSGGWSSAEGLAWSPSGDEIWFAAGKEEGPNALYAVTSSGRARLLARFPRSVRLHDVSRNGRALLTEDYLREELVFGSTSKPTERDLSWLDFSVPIALSPDGEMLLFYEGGIGGGTSGATYIRKTDGSPAVKLGEGMPQALSPDRRWALSSLYTQRPPKLILYSIGAGETKALNLAGLQYLGSAEWLADGKRILFQGTEPGHRPRVYVQQLPDARPTPITPEIAEKGPTSTDGRFVIVSDSEDRFLVYPVTGGRPIPVYGITRADDILGWSADSHFLYVCSIEMSSAKVYRVDPATGHRNFWKELGPRDATAVLGLNSLLLTPDGKSYAFGYARQLGDLYLVDGLK